MYSPILVPVDGSATADRGLREAVTLAAALGAKLVLLHVVDDFHMMMELASSASYEADHEALVKAGHALLDRSARMAAEAGVGAEPVLREVKAVPAADVIVSEAESRRCGLIVMGTHGRRGMARLTLGSTAELVLRHAPVPVLLVRARGATS